MESKELENIDSVVSMPAATTSTHIVTADSVQAEEVPTIPLGSLQTISSLQPEVSVHSVASTPMVSMPTPLVAQPTESRRSMGQWLQVWLDAMRPLYLPLSVMPFLLGSVLAWTQTVTSRTPLGHVQITHFLLALVAVIVLQLGAHLINDYYDYLRGIDTSNAFGPGGLIQQGLVRPTRVLTFGLALLGIGALLGIIVAATTNSLLFLIGIVGVLAAFFYSATGRSLASIGLSEVVGFVIFGPLVTVGAYLALGGTLLSSALIYSLPLGFLAAAVIHVNNMRDSEGDAQGGKRTIATLLGLGGSRVWCLVLVFAAYAIVVFLGVPHRAPHWILLSLWTLPILVVVVTGVVRTDSPAGLQLVMRETLKLAGFFAFWLIIGLIVTALLPVLPHIPTQLLPM